MQLGGHELLDSIGQGGAGIVYRARSPEGAFVAVKVFRGASRDSLARFEREQRLQGGLTADDGFVPIMATGDSPNGPYIVMPLVSGGTLRERYAKRGTFTVEEALKLGERLGSALGKIHERGIVHRDLKPENILFTSAGAPLIADLGLAKHFRREMSGAAQSAALSRTGTFLGTAGYMAPEQMLDASKVGPQADVFSLGAVLYECLAGAGPFEAAGVVDIVVKVELGKFRPLRGWRNDVPRWLAKVIERCLSPTPADRFVDGGAVARALAAGAPRSGALAGGLALAGALGVAAVVAVFVFGAGSKTTGVAFTPPPPPPPPAPAPPPARSTGEPAVTVDELLARAEAAKRRGDAQAAIRAVEEAVALDPKSILARGALAYARFAQGDRDGALEIAERCMAIDPRSPDAWLVRGRVRFMRNELAAAFADCDRAVQLGPALARAYTARGGLRTMLRDDKGAEEDARKAVELDPKDSSAWVNLALSRRHFGDLKGVIEATTRAILVDPFNSGAYSNRGLARSEQGDLEGALTDLDRAVELNPTVAALLNRGYVRKRLRGDLRLCREDADRALALEPKNAGARAFKGLVEVDLGEDEAAFSDLTAAIDMGVDEDEVWFQRGLLRLKLGDAGGAQADAAKVLEVSPNHVRALILRGRALILQEKLELAGKDLDRAVGLAPREIEAYLNRSVYHAARGDRIHATSDAKKVIELAPDSPQAALAHRILEKLAELGGR